MSTKSRAPWMNWDVARPTYGRDDSPELIDACVEYLENSHVRRPSAKPGSSVRASGELVAARVREASRGPQAATIDRLLAFVPSRARALNADRVQAILDDLLTQAADLWPGQAVHSAVIDETDDDTLARHRLVLWVTQPEGADIGEFASKVFRLHFHAAGVLTEGELQAIRLVVEPRAG